MSQNKLSQIILRLLGLKQAHYPPALKRYRRSLNDELSEILGWFNFNDESINIQFPSRDQCADKDPIFAHESAHRHLVNNTTFGGLQRLISRINRTSPDPTVQSQSAEALRLSIENSIHVQEALATYHEYLAAGPFTQKNLEEAKQCLPDLYRTAFDTMEMALPFPLREKTKRQQNSPMPTGQPFGSALPYAIAATVVAELALNRPLVSHLPSVKSILNTKQFECILTTLSPDEFFRTLCESIKSFLDIEDALKALTRILEESTSRHGSYMRADLGMERASVNIGHGPAAVASIWNEASNSFYSYLVTAMPDAFPFQSREGAKREIDSQFQIWSTSLLKFSDHATCLEPAQAETSNATIRSRTYFLPHNLKLKRHANIEIDCDTLTRFLVASSTAGEQPLLRLGAGTDKHTNIVGLSFDARHSRPRLSTACDSPSGYITCDMVSRMHKDGLKGTESGFAWAIPRYIAQQWNLEDLPGVCGVAYLFDNTFDEGNLDSLIHKFRTSEGAAIVRSIILQGCNTECLLVTGPHCWYGYAMPCDILDYRRFIDRYRLESGIMTGARHHAGQWSKLWQSNIVGMALGLAFRPDQWSFLFEEEPLS